MQPLHADREHALWSASSSARNIACPGALALTMGMQDFTSEAADWGTCCHQVSEKCLQGGFDADTLIGTTEKGKKYANEVDEEMADTAQTYVDYVRGVAVEGTTLMIEQRFDLKSLGTPFDAGGTGDAVIYIPWERRIEVVDLKGGRGVVVEANGNPQLRTYGLGAILANPSLKVDRVTVTIVQPRAAHPDGRIRSETLDVLDLLDWTGEMLAAMRRSEQALAAKADLAPSAWAAAFLRPGPHCGSTFCKAQGTCPALEQKVMDEVGIWFSPEGNANIANVPESEDPVARAQRLDMLDMIEDWVKSVRATEHRKAETGNPAAGYGLVSKQGREKWNDDTEDAVRLVCDMAGLPVDKFVSPGKLRTPKQVRAALKDQAKLVDGMSAATSSGTNLVRLDGSVRQEVVAPAISLFSPV